MTAGAGGTAGWRVGWPLTTGQRITQSWNEAVTTGGTTVIADNARWNGTLAAGAMTSFGFLSDGTAGTPALTRAAR